MKKKVFLREIFDLDVFGDYRLEFNKIDSETLEITLICFDEFTKTVCLDEQFIYDLEGNIITTIETLDKFEEWNEFNLCKDCFGTGYVEIDVSSQCLKYIGDCCGGCTQIVECYCK